MPGALSSKEGTILPVSDFFIEACDVLKAAIMAAGTLDSEEPFPLPFLAKDLKLAIKALDDGEFGTKK